MSTDKRCNIMIDIETLALTEDAAIMQIGAVKFDFEDGVVGTPFCAGISDVSNAWYGRVADAATLDWWDKQDAEVRDEVMNGTVSLRDALLALSDWMDYDNPNKHPFAIWANGANFDGPILRSAYAATDTSCPWKYYQERCYRTIVEPYYDVVPRGERTTKKHDALADAMFQVDRLLQVVKAVKSDPTMVAAMFP